MGVSREQISLGTALRRGSLLLGVDRLEVEPVDSEDEELPDTKEACRHLQETLQNQLTSLLKYVCLSVTLSFHHGHRARTKVEEKKEDLETRVREKKTRL